MLELELFLPLPPPQVSFREGLQDQFKEQFQFQHQGGTHLPGSNIGKERSLSRPPCNDDPMYWKHGVYFAWP